MITAASDDDAALTLRVRSWHDESMQPALGLISHGTSSPDGQSVISALAEAVAADLRGRGVTDTVVLGHVDVQSPDVAEVLATLPADRTAVLVPLLLSPGYHVHVDLAEAVARAGSHRDIRVGATLGPDPRLVEVLAARLPELTSADEVVLAAAGSSDERANDASREVGRLLAARLDRPVSTAFLAGDHDRLSHIVEQKKHLGEHLVVANYLLAPGYFDDLAASLVSAVGGRLSEPLLHPSSPAPKEIIAIVADRMAAVL